MVCWFVEARAGLLADISCSSPSPTLPYLTLSLIDPTAQQESYITEEAVNNAGNFDAQKTARLAELETLLDAHKREVADLAKQVGHWRGLVERYGGSTTEIVDLEERERRGREEETGSVVKNSLAEQLKLNEEMQEGESSWCPRNQLRSPR